MFLFQNTRTHKIIIRTEGVTQIKPEPKTGNSALAAHIWWYTKNKSAVVSQENFLLVNYAKYHLHKTHLFVDGQVASTAQKEYGLSVQCMQN